MGGRKEEERRARGGGRGGREEEKWRGVPLPWGGAGEAKHLPGGPHPSIPGRSVPILGGGEPGDSSLWPPSSCMSLGTPVWCPLGPCAALRTCSCCGGTSCPRAALRAAPAAMRPPRRAGWEGLPASAEGAPLRWVGAAPAAAERAAAPGLRGPGAGSLAARPPLRPPLALWPPPDEGSSRASSPARLMRPCGCRAPRRRSSCQRHR